MLGLHVCMCVYIYESLLLERFSNCLYFMLIMYHYLCTILPDKWGAQKVNIYRCTYTFIYIYRVVSVSNYSVIHSKVLYCGLQYFGLICVFYLCFFVLFCNFFSTNSAQLTTSSMVIDALLKLSLLLYCC